MDARVTGRPWREPAELLPLGWGAYRGRYLVGLALLLGGALVVQAGSVYVPQLMLLGMGAHLLGWWMLPGHGWRRIAVSLPSLIVVMLLLNGATDAVFVIVPLAGWLWVRQRPARAYLVLIPPVISGSVLTVFFAQYGSGALVLSVTGAVVCASAWLARLLAIRMRLPRDSSVDIG